MTSKLKCHKCQANIERDFKFCAKCGSSLDLECIKCFTRADSNFNFCTNCGTKMVKSDFSSNLARPNVDGNTCDRLQNSLTTHSLTKCKVNILFGNELKEIKQDEGGGKRTVQFLETDKFHDIKKRIIDFYFPKNCFTCLGSPEDYRISILNYQKLPFNRFVNYGTYLKSTGLAPNRQALFFLHLTKDNGFKYNDRNRSNVVTTTSTMQSTRSIMRDKDMISRIDSQTVPSTSPSQSKSPIKPALSNLVSPKQATLEKKSENSKSENSNNLKDIIHVKSELELPNHKVFNSPIEITNKRARSSSSSSSYSSSSGESSFAKSDKLTRVYNKRLEKCKQTSSTTPTELTKKPTTSNGNQLRTETPIELTKKPTTFDDNQLKTETNSIVNTDTQISDNKLIKYNEPKDVNSNRNQNNYTYSDNNLTTSYNSNYQYKPRYVNSFKKNYDNGYRHHNQNSYHNNGNPNYRVTNIRDNSRYYSQETSQNDKYRNANNKYN